jgi:uncharacterized membrane-anchored protein YitT (DUF2179 family)
MQKFKNCIIIFTGCVLYALSVVVFTAPNNIAPGGLTGIGTMLNYLFSIPIGVFILVMNAPLFFAGYKILGRQYALRSAFGTIVSSVLIDIFTVFIPEYNGDMILASVFGGVINGIGLGLIFSRGGSTGGSDIIASVINKFRPDFSVGRIILVSDAVIVLCSAFVYHNAENALYAVVSIFVGSRMIDTVTYGTSRGNGKLMFIITDKSAEILEEFLREIPRGVTVLSSYGAYSGKNRDILLCALRPNQLFKAENIARKHDENTFIIVTTATDVKGLGFIK